MSMSKRKEQFPREKELETMNIIMYTTKGCSCCEKAKQYLNDKHITYNTVDLSIGGNPDIQSMKRKFMEWGLRDLPITIIDDCRIIEGFVKAKFDKTFNENSNHASTQPIIQS
jgi:glutaredoxin